MTKILRSVIAHVSGRLLLAALLGLSGVLLCGMAHLVNQADGRKGTQELAPRSPFESPESCYTTSSETPEQMLVRPTSDSNLNRFSSGSSCRPRRFQETLSEIFQRLHGAIPAGSSDYRSEKWPAISPALLLLAAPVRAGPTA